MHIRYDDITYISIVVAITDAKAAEVAIVTIAVANDVQIAHRGQRRERDGSGNRSRLRDAGRGRRRDGSAGHRDVVGVVAVVPIGHGQAVAARNDLVGGALEADEAGGAFCSSVRGQWWTAKREILTNGDEMCC